MRLPFWIRLLFLHLTGVAHRAEPTLPPWGYVRTPGPRRARALAEKLPKPVLRLEVEVLEAGTAELVVRLRGEAGVAEAVLLEDTLSRLVAGARYV